MKKATMFTALAFALGLAAGQPVEAGEVSKSVPFEFDKWIDLNVTDGPCTLHRIRIVKKSGGVTKSLFARPGNSEYLEDVQIQLEYTNDATKDWEAHLTAEWLDGDGKVIDGYNDDESLDSESRADDTTVTLSTLKYGLQKAKKFNVKINFQPD